MLRTRIAVKILHERFAKDRELADALRARGARDRRARSSRRSSRVHDAGTTDDGCPYIEMDMLEGRELYSLRKDAGPLAARARRVDRDRRSSTRSPCCTRAA